MSRSAYDGGGIYLEASCSVPRPSGEDRAVGGVRCASQEGAGTFESSRASGLLGRTGRVCTGAGRRPLRHERRGPQRTAQVSRVVLTEHRGAQGCRRGGSRGGGARGVVGRAAAVP